MTMGDHLIFIYVGCVERDLRCDLSWDEGVGSRPLLVELFEKSNSAIEFLSARDTWVLGRRVLVEDAKIVSNALIPTRTTRRFEEMPWDPK
jgi:hypothetical protein